MARSAKSPAKKSAAAKNKVAARRTSGATPRKVKARRPRPGATLGRPRVTGEELLYMLFKEDYHARQIFTFLRVETLKELEVHSAAEILRKLSQPIRDTVERIRKTLAGYNRHLAGDLEYALAEKARQAELPS